MSTFFAKDGVIVPHDVVSLLDHGLLLGDGIYETLRIEASRLCFFEDHYARLTRGAALLDLPLPEKEILLTTIGTLLLHSGYHDARLRLTITRGEGSPGLSTTATTSHWFLTLSPLLPSPASIAVVFASGERPLPEVKSLNALPQVLAYRQAELQGAKEALMVNRDGQVTEGTYSNYFCVREGRYMTPSLHLLPGITRMHVLRLLHELALPVLEVPSLTPDLLRSADALFLTSTLLGIVPVGTLDGHSFPPHSPLPRLQEAFEQRRRQYATLLI